jgi:hypothetical protein
MASEALVCDIHVPETDELLCGWLDSTPTLSYPFPVTKHEVNDSRIRDR